MGLFSKKKTQTEKQELRYLNRKDVLELLREQTRRSAALEKEVEELKAQVKEREAFTDNELEQHEDREDTAQSAD